MPVDPVHEDARQGQAMMLKPPGERSDPWACACSPKHKNPWECLSISEVETWRIGHPEATVSDRGAKALLWMQQTFGGR